MISTPHLNHLSENKVRPMKEQLFPKQSPSDPFCNLDDHGAAACREEGIVTVWSPFSERTLCFPRTFHPVAFNVQELNPRGSGHVVQPLGIQQRRSRRALCAADCAHARLGDSGTRPWPHPYLRATSERDSEPLEVKVLRGESE